MKVNAVIHDDIFNVMPNIADKSIDMILTDMPYNTTACSWDKEVIPLDKLWEWFKRIIKDNGAIVMTASQPFTSKLVMSNIKMFKYEWIWGKEKGANFASCKKTPMKIHENILVFGGSKYNPIMKERPIKNRRNNKPRINKSSQTGTKWLCEKSKGNLPIKYPETILKFNSCREYLHPTQKPIALFEYLIKTYTNKGDTVFDGFAGSFTTAIAAQNLKRNWICVEKEEKYCEIGRKRLAQGVLNI